MKNKIIWTGFSKMLLGILFITHTAFAQNNTQNNKELKRPHYTGYFDLNLNMGIPMQEYGTATTSIPFGFNLSYMHQPNRKVPLLIGGDLGYLGVGSKTNNRTLTSDITANGVLIDRLEIPLRFVINNNLLASHLKLRFLSPTEYVKVYIDGIGGFNYLWTATAVYDKSEQHYFTKNGQNDNGLIRRKTQLQSLTYSAGAGVGLLIQLEPNFFLNMAAHYAFGGRANYYDNSQIKNWNIGLNTSGYSPNQSGGTLTDSDLTVDATPKRSKTDMLLIQLGVCWNILSR